MVAYPSAGVVLFRKKDGRILKKDARIPVWNLPSGVWNLPSGVSNHRRAASNLPSAGTSHPRPVSKVPSGVSNHRRPVSNHRSAVSKPRSGDWETGCGRAEMSGGGAGDWLRSCEGGQRRSRAQSPPGYGVPHRYSNFDAGDGRRVASGKPNKILRARVPVQAKPDHATVLTSNRYVAILQ